MEVNCATLRGDTAMSTLFGHVKGAFTGRGREGSLRSANGGMLFLDEIGELGADEQAMLLKAIEEKTFYPFGSDRQVSSNFQLIAKRCAIYASWLQQAICQDLYARIKSLDLHLAGAAPAMRNRLNRTLIMKWSATLHSPATACVLTPKRGAPGWPLRHLPGTWRGNFRELSASVLTRMATFASSGRITLDVVEDEINRLRYNWQESRPSALTALLGAEAENIDLFDRMQLEHVIAICRQAKSLSAAGRQLFDVSRQGKASVNDADRLRKDLARFGLTWEAVQDQHSSS